MINELYGLSKALESAEIASEEWHRKYKPLPNVTKKNPCIRIWLGNEGICGFESLNQDSAACLKKFGSNQGTFPAMNLVPLYRITDETQKQELEAIKQDLSLLNIEKLHSWCASNNWTPNFVSKLKNSVYKVSQELAAFVGQASSIERQELDCLIRLLTQHFPETQCEQMHAALERVLFRKLEQAEDVPLALSILFHAGSSEKEPNKDQGTLSVIWDLEDWHDFEYPIASEHFTRALNQMLLSAERLQQTGKDKASVDAFHTLFSPTNEKMPSVKLAGGFEATIYTMFEGQPCQDRYANFERSVSSYPLAPENRSSFKKALEWISGAERQGETWTKTDKNEILFVYPSKLPGVPIKYAGLFGTGGSTSAVVQEKRFEKQASEFAQCLSGLPTEKRPDHIRVFVLQKIDKARTKILCTRNTTPEQLIAAADAWQEGCRNLPAFGFTNLDSNQLKVPYPLQVASVINQVWKRDGQTSTQGKTAVRAMHNYQGIELLLDTPAPAVNRHYLILLLDHYTNLAIWYGNILHAGKRQEVCWQEEQLRKALPVLGLLLYQHNIRKEQYMESYPYLLGQLLKASDELHAHYCRVVRDGQLPPQLVGSSLYVSAAETPVAAFGQLGSRMSPYISWAKQYAGKGITKEGEESWKALWLLNTCTRIADLLKTSVTPQPRFNEYEKAQLFLGYLASLPKAESKNKSDENEGEEPK